MTKKDYQAIAREVYTLGLGRDLVTMTDVIELLGRVFKADNPRFDWSRFQEACLTGKCKGMKGV